MLDQVETRAHRTNLAPIPMECDAPHLKIVGELPRELNGTLYRNGPNPQFEAPGAHWFLGDGMLHAFHLENGRASYRNRWVRTPKWQAEHDAGRALFGGFGGRKLPDAPATSCTDSGVANTNIIFHGGRLLALEEGHLPTEIEPGTLNRLGYCDYGKGIAGPFTAHPKIDPVTGEMVFFGYNAAGPLTPALSFGSINAAGVVTRFDRFEAPYASMVHDFIVTDNHLLFPILPITGSMERAMRGKPAYAWEPEKGAYVGVMKRNGSPEDLVWFRAESCYVFHVMNAWEDGERIIADVMQFEEA
ncbi:MAG: carotenoid oxygenase family protein, partial [Bradyrhizobium sp.]|nr:carotenoid oxygenase family protein [Bradyrhizobium sp.]